MERETGFSTSRKLTTVAKAPSSDYRYRIFLSGQRHGNMSDTVKSTNFLLCTRDSPDWGVPAILTYEDRVMD